MTVESYPALSPQREDMRDVKRHRCHDPFLIDAMKYKMIGEARWPILSRTIANAKWGRACYHGI